MTASVDRKAVQEPGPETATELENLLAGRYSCRAFRSNPVPKPVLIRLLKMAQLTASWCNTQPWQLIITSGVETEKFRAALSAHAHEVKAQMTPDLTFPLQYQGLYRDRKRECGWQLYESVAIARDDRAASGRQMMANFSLFGAPHAVIVTTERDLGTYGAIDCGAYIANFLSSAQALGLGCIAQAALAGCAPFLRTYFDLPDNRVIVCGISLGYADDAHPINSFRTRRASIDDVVEWKE